MKGPKELKRYVAMNRKRLKACRWDDLWVMRLQTTCKKWKQNEKDFHERRDETV